MRARPEDSGGAPHVPFKTHAFIRNLRVSGAVSIRSTGLRAVRNYTRQRGVSGSNPVAHCAWATHDLYDRGREDASSRGYERSTGYQLSAPDDARRFSIAISQQPGNINKLLPLIAVEQSDNCIPVSVPNATCTVTGSETGDPFVVLLNPQQIHILTTCDAPMVNRVEAFFTSACAPVIVHLDGSLVSASGPAKVGEMLVIYAVGLGLTSPVVRAGDPAPTPPPVAQGRFTLSFAYQTAAGPPAQQTSLLGQNPVFVGLTPTEAGVYSVNFFVEGPPAGSALAACTDPDQANLTIALFSDGSPSMDIARFCVEAGT